ncbi:TfoX/Sxy family protein [Chromobacterium paludis]|uniref:TfoX/Sxy family protein n=1 Tax=Chromobacterium paludis TaxID=2605945 RepID=A0A5C1DIL8_9NEIS|nr:TfoX/Sxy family protein [Chromobacterium paludis]
MSGPIASLRGLGPQSSRMLAAAGIASLAQLQELGAVGAYLRVRAAWPGASLNLLWALEGALTGRDWRAVAREERTRLLLELDVRSEQGR